MNHIYKETAMVLTGGSQRIKVVDSADIKVNVMS